MAHSREAKRFALLGALFVFIGLSLTFFALYEEQVSQGSIQQAHTVKHSGILLLEKLGLTLIVFGLIDLLLHLPALNRHFLDGLRDLVIHDSYLRRLSPSRLTDLVNRAFQAQTENPEVELGREGSFLDYFHNSIRGFIQEPYREGAVCEVEYTDLVDNAEYYQVKDKLTYVCRKASGAIQKNVRWENDPEEVEGNPLVSIWVQLPNTTADTKKLLVDDKRFKYKYRDDSTLYDELQDGKVLECSILEESLRNYADKDGLIVTIEAEYRIRKNRFLYWQMSHLTKGMTLTLLFPRNVNVQVVPFVQGSDKRQETKRDNYYKVTYNQWILPDAGICWRLSEGHA